MALHVLIDDKLIMSTWFKGFMEFIFFNLIDV